MAEEIRIWQVGEKDTLIEIKRSRLDLEDRIEKWIVGDISLLSPDVLVIGEQVETASGGFIDVLCIDRSGNLVIVELKRDKTPREVTAQALDYASWVKDLDASRIKDIAAEYLNREKRGTLEAAFQSKFGVELPDVINEHHAMRIVASEIDDSTERIIRYLSETYGVDINAVRFQFFQGQEGRQLLVRSFTVAPEEAATNIAKGPRKRSPRPTLEEMEKIASDRGVGELYLHFKQALPIYFRFYPTRTSIYFGVWPLWYIGSVVPGESSAEAGLKYYLASKRVADLIHVGENEIVAHLPRNPEHYAEANYPEYNGWTGFIKDDEDIQKIVDLLKRIEPKGSRAA